MNKIHSFLPQTFKIIINNVDTNLDTPTSCRSPLANDLFEKKTVLIQEELFIQIICKTCQKISMPTPRLVIGNSKGRGGVKSQNVLGISMRLNWNLWRGGEGVQTEKKKFCRVGGMDIFWNNTVKEVTVY